MTYESDKTYQITSLRYEREHKIFDLKIFVVYLIHMLNGVLIWSNRKIRDIITQSNCLK